MVLQNAQNNFTYKIKNFLGNKQLSADNQGAKTQVLQERANGYGRMNAPTTIIPSCSLSKNVHENKWGKWEKSQEKESDRKKDKQKKWRNKERIEWGRFHSGHLLYWILFTFLETETPLQVRAFPAVQLTLRLVGLHSQIESEKARISRTTHIVAKTSPRSLTIVLVNFSEAFRYVSMTTGDFYAHVSFNSLS